MKVFRPGLAPQYVDEPAPAPSKPAAPTQSELIKRAIASANARHAAAALLRQDGPTLAEYVAAGYDPKTYPPVGYAENPPPAEPPMPMFGTAPTELIPIVKPLPLVDNNVSAGDPQVDPLLK